MKAIVFSSVLAGTALMVGPASAEIYLVRQPQPCYVACYVREYVPAKVLVNTRGRLVAKETTVWEISGDRWNRVRSPAVYMETRRVVAPDHYKLVPVACP